MNCSVRAWNNLGSIRRTDWRICCHFFSGRLATMKPNPLSLRAHTPGPSPPKQKTPRQSPIHGTDDNSPSFSNWLSDQFGWLTSLIVHVALILSLAMIVLPGVNERPFAFKTEPPSTPEPLDPVELEPVIGEIDLRLASRIDPEEFEV